MKNKPYKLVRIARQVQDRNIRENVHPDRFRIGENRKMYLARVQMEK